MSNEQKKTPGVYVAPAPATTAGTGLTPELQELVSSALKQGIADGIAMASQMTADRAAAKTVAETPVVKQQLGRCSECQQMLASCKSKHRQVAVYPVNPNHGRWFQGVIINGVTYLSNSAQHKIPIPEDANVEYLVAEWERNEDQLLTGRQSFHDSGSVQRFNQATSAWR